MTLTAYHGREELKARVLAELAAHRAADRLVQGCGYWEDGKGCAVGCTLESLRVAEGLPSINHRSHQLYERYLGVPQAVARLEDGLFESLPKDLAQAWPERFAAAIRPGADLSMVVPRFLHWLLTRPEGGVQRGVAICPAIGPVVARVATLYQQWIDGAKPSDTEWREARSAAYAAAAAAAAAAYAAAYAADADAAAYAAADAAADAARRTERASQADYLIALLEAA